MTGQQVGIILQHSGHATGWFPSVQTQHRPQTTVSLQNTESPITPPRDTLFMQFNKRYLTSNKTQESRSARYGHACLLWGSLRTALCGLYLPHCSLLGTRKTIAHPGCSMGIKELIRNAQIQAPSGRPQIYRMNLTSDIPESQALRKASKSWAVYGTAGLQISDDSSLCDLE